MKYFNNRDLISVYSRWLAHTKAWKTDKKIVVIESDDWGSIRTSNKEAYDAFVDLGYDMTKSPYTLDALESNEDLAELYTVLNSVKDALNKSACITANMIMANPDFAAIANSNYENYVYETVDKTLAKNIGRNRVRELWKEGLKSKVFFPQLHAREHLRYWDWMRDLKARNFETLETFKYEMCGLPKRVSKMGTSYFNPPYIDDEILFQQGVDLKRLISEGVELFKSEFGFVSKTTIAPNCGWTSSCERIWKENNIQFIQGGYIQEHHSANKTKYFAHYLGERSKTEGLTYLVRNCTFEPAASSNPNYWEGTFKQIEKAFRNNTPALISSHRVNYVGSIDKRNRDNSLEQLSKLLSRIVKTWPEVIFLNSEELSELI